MKLLCTLLLLLISLTVFSQESNKNSFGIAAGIGSAVIIAEPLLVGGPSVVGKRSLNAGFNYYRQLTGKLKLETGFFWHTNTITVTPPFHPSIDRTTSYYDVDIIYIPVFARLIVLKHFFISGGIIGSVDLSSSEQISKQTGIGAGGGLGYELFLGKHLALQINPYLNLHGLAPTENEQYRERISDNGIKLGIRTR